MGQTVQLVSSRPPVPTIGEYFERWIKKKVPPLVRPQLARDYRQAFSCYILPRFGDVALNELTTVMLSDFLIELVSEEGLDLSIKTAKNVIGGTFRALYRDARSEYPELNALALSYGDPFRIKWPQVERLPPDPFTIEERDKIIAAFLDKEPYFYQFVKFAFDTGARPSEITGLTWNDFDCERRTVSISKSLVNGFQGQTKTRHSNRVILISRDLAKMVSDLLQRRPEVFSKPTDRIFLNKVWQPITTAHFRSSYWDRLLKRAKVPYRKFYSTRHTHITEMIEQNVNPKVVADYHGTSMAMIEANYCRKQSYDPDGENTVTGYRPEPSPSDKSKQPAITSAQLKAAQAKYARRWKKKAGGAK